MRLWYHISVALIWKIYKTASTPFVDVVPTAMPDVVSGKPAAPKE